MTLYNLVFGMNPAADLIVALLGWTKMDVPRFRDAWVEKAGDGYEIRIHTRMGGDNAGHWDFSTDDDQAGPECLCPGCVMDYQVFQHPQYLRHADDEFDNTYRDVWFRVSPEATELAGMLVEPEKVDVPVRWVKELEAMERGEIKPEVRKVVTDLLEQIAEQF